LSKPSEHDLAIEPVHEDGGVRLVLTGELDLACASRLADAIVEHAEPGSTLIVDLTSLEFMDSSGLGTLLQAREDAERDGWDLALASNPGPVDRIFDLTDTRDLLRFV
jgi:anti-sigma B factor antagonist